MCRCADGDFGDNDHNHCSKDIQEFLKGTINNGLVFLNWGLIFKLIAKFDRTTRSPDKTFRIFFKGYDQQRPGFSKPGLLFLML